MISLTCWSVFAEEAVTDYIYDDLYRLVLVDCKADVNGHGFRTLYTVSYSYDDNGNRIGMTRTAANPELDATPQATQFGNQITVQLIGFGFQEGMTVSLQLGCGDTVLGIITAISPTSATVTFTSTCDLLGTNTLTVLNPDGGTTSEMFTGPAPLPATESVWYLVIFVLLATFIVAGFRFSPVRKKIG